VTLFHVAPDDLLVASDKLVMLEEARREHAVAQAEADQAVLVLAKRVGDDEAARLLHCPVTWVQGARHRERYRR
jgi:hypothetical protein